MRARSSDRQWGHVRDVASQRGGWYNQIVAVCPRCQLRLDDDVLFCPKDGARLQFAEPAEPPEHDEHVGQLLGDEFEILEIAGKGAMGTVYRAQQRAMDRVVAIKILRRELLRDTGLVRRFVREARATAKLQHPNIVTVHFVGETPEGLPFLVMEYVDGRSLEQVCETPMPLGRVLEIARQITSALGDAHDMGIIHRDLKPSNILVIERPNQPDRVKVVDFGIAKILEWGDGRESMLTQGGVIFGTPDYLAPEQASGAPVDARTDLYALGVILFRLVTGQLPFVGTGMQLVLKHLREIPPLPSTLAPDIPPDVEELIVMLLSKEPDHRPANARAVELTLRRLQSTLDGPAAKPPEAARPNAKRAVRVVPTTGRLTRPSKPVRTAQPSPEPRYADEVRDLRSRAGDAEDDGDERSVRRIIFALAAALCVGTGGGLLLAHYRRHALMAPVVTVVERAANPTAPEAVARTVPTLHTTATPPTAGRRRPHRDDDGTMPVTVFPATPNASPGGYPQVPLRLPTSSSTSGPAKPATSAKYTPPPPSAPIVMPPVAPVERSVIVEQQEHPRPAPAKEAPAKEPPVEPAPVEEAQHPADPTTIPLPQQ